MSDFGKIFKSIRLEKGLKQKDIREILNLKSRQAISHWETGRFTPEIETIQKLADYFKIDIEYLLGNTPFRTKLEEAQNDFRTTIEKAREYCGDASIKPYISTLDNILSELVSETKSEFTKSIDPYIYGSILLEISNIMKKTNKFAEQFYRMKGSCENNSGLAAFAYRGYTEICSGIAEKIIEWVTDSSVGRQNRIDEMFRITPVDEAPMQG